VDLLLVRHAEPERVAGGTGVRADPPLTARGKEQAAALAAWLAHEPVDAVLSSPMRRALETAEPTAAAHEVVVEIVDGLAEFDAQADDYIPIEELKATNDPRWRAMASGTWEGAGGEEPEVFRTRVLAAFDDVVARYAGRRVVAVCHGGVVNCVVGSLLGIGKPLWFEPAYSSLHRIAASRSGVRSIVTLNETAHLIARRLT
jgi:probable phosphoglycerate mutase